MLVVGEAAVIPHQHQQTPVLAAQVVVQMAGQNLQVVTQQQTLAAAVEEQEVLEHQARLILAAQAALALSSSSTKRLLTECYLSPVPLNGLAQQV